MVSVNPFASSSVETVKRSLVSISVKVHDLPECSPPNVIVIVLMGDRARRRADRHCGRL